MRYNLRERLMTLVRNRAPGHDIFKECLEMIDFLSKAENAARETAWNMEQQRDQEAAIVSRIWEQLGNPTYEELNGRSIYDLIDELKDNANANAGAPSPSTLIGDG